MLHNGVSIPIRFLQSSSTTLERANFTIMQGLSNHLRSTRWDIIQCSEDIQPSTLQASLFKGTARLVIFQGINHYSYNTIKNLPMKAFDLTAGPWLRHRTDLVIAKTKEAERFMRSKGYQKVLTIPMGVDLDLFHPYPREEGQAFLRERGAALEEFTLIYVGNLIQRRDVATLLRGLKVARAQGLKAALTIIGKGPEEAYLRALASELGISKTVSFLETIPNAELALAYSGADAFVFSPLHEIFGMVILEATACQLPVLSTPVPAILDLIEGYREHGIKTFPFGDHLALGNFLVELAHNPEWRLKMGKANRHIAEQHSWSVVASRIRNAYQRILQ